LPALRACHEITEFRMQDVIVAMRCVVCYFASAAFAFLLCAGIIVLPEMSLFPVDLEVATSASATRSRNIHICPELSDLPP
jgi:hypothetical protein